MAHRGTAFGFHRSLDTVGAVIGPLLGFVALGYLGAGYRTLFWLAGLPSIAAVLCLLALRVPSAGSLAPPGAHATTTSGRSLAPALRRYFVVTAIFSLGNSSNVFVLLRARDLGWGEQQVIGLYVLYNAVYALASTPAGRLSDRLGRRRVVSAGFLTFALAYVGLALASTRLAVAIILVGYGLYSAMLGSAGRALVADLSDETNRARAMGAYQAVTGSLLLISSPLAGLLWSHVGPAAPFWFGAATATGATLLFLSTGTGEPPRDGAGNPAAANLNGGADGS